MFQGTPNIPALLQLCCFQPYSSILLSRIPALALSNGCCFHGSPQVILRAAGVL